MADQEGPKLGRLLDEGVFSDLTITCHGREFKVHKNILYASSEYFRTLLTGPFKESSASMIDFPDDDPDDLHHLIFYIYHSEFLAQHGDRMSGVMSHARLYAIADKYNIPFIREAIVMLLRWLTDDTFSYMFDARKPHEEEAKDVQRYVELLRFVETSTCDNALLDHMMSSVETYLSTLMRHESFKLLLSELPDFNVKLLAQLASRRNQRGNNSQHAWWD